jgi:sugar-specific transcriptional regulator TrmB
MLKYIYMANTLVKSPSPQATAIYSLLQTSGARSAKEIGKELKIFPNAVYRAMKQLMVLGFVEEIFSYPVKFQAKPASQALELYLGAARQGFGEAFGFGNNQLHIHKLLPLTFTQTRNQLLKMTAKDERVTKSEVNLIASGLEVPAETVLCHKRAVERGVRVRIIVQNLDEVRVDMLRNWQKAGVEVKYYPKIESRIFVFDHRIVYFTSYNPKNIEEAIGMRFEYAPFAVMMDELFEQRWQLAKDIDGVLR